MKRRMVKRICVDCGNVSIVRADGVGERCRKCRAIKNSKTRKPKDLTGKKSGYLTVISLSHIEKVAYWNCVCICGKKCVIHGTRLRYEKTKSCGCISKKRNGLSNSGTYRSWQAMIERCYNKKAPHYQRYGAQGITICESWLNSFENFYRDMGERPEGKTLDRKNFYGNYEPGNCKWSTPKEQGNNTKNNFIIRYQNKEMTLTQWAEKYNIHWSTLRKRIVDLKWTVKEALTTKVRKHAIKER